MFNLNVLILNLASLPMRRVDKYDTIPEGEIFLHGPQCLGGGRGVDLQKEDRANTGYMSFLSCSGSRTFR
jgi:hypothetical protein